MYANDDSDSESTSKATTPGRSTTAEITPTTKPLPKTRTLKVVKNAGASHDDHHPKEPVLEKQRIVEEEEIEAAQTVVQRRPPSEIIRPSIIETKPREPELIEPIVHPSQFVVSPNDTEEAKDEQQQQHVVPPQTARRPSRDKDHLSIACHLFPRLSETNLNFHDIYWGVDPKNQSVFLRKRVVNVSKMFRFHTLQPTRKPSPTSADELSGFQLRLYLVDTRPRAQQQIVSNIHEIPISVHQSRFGLFCQKTPAETMLVRSNYKQSEVILRVELLQSLSSLGLFDIPLLDAQQNSRLPSRTQTLNIGDFKLSFDAWDPPTRLVPQTDCLPDILICPEEWIPMIATFRQLSAEVLAQREKEQQTTWICDPVLATFPTICGFRRLTEIFLCVLNRRQRYDTATFRRMFMQFMYPIVHTAQIETDEQATDYRLQIEKANGNPLEFLIEEQSEPLNVNLYAVHLSSYHAID